MSDGLKEIENALENGNFFQAAIAAQGIAVIKTLLRKNADYGHSAFKPPALLPGLKAADAILVRLSDKFERIANLAGGHRPTVDESLRDTMLDVAGYAILWLIQDGVERAKEWGPEPSDGEGDG